MKLKLTLLSAGALSQTFHPWPSPIQQLLPESQADNSARGLVCLSPGDSAAGRVCISCTSILNSTPLCYLFKIN